MTEAEIRAAVNNWSSEGFSRQKHLGDRMAIAQATAVSTYVVRFATQREQRTIMSVTDHDETPIDPRVARVDPQSIHVQLPKGLQGASANIAVPGSRRIATCTRCTATGAVTCGKCGGKGKTQCGFCHGFATQRQMRSIPIVRNGRTTFQTQWVTVPCTCRGGWVRCNECKSAGTVTCASCAGKGQIRSIGVLHVQFLTTTASPIVNATGVPDDLLSATRGTTFVDADVAGSVTPPGLPLEVSAAVGALRDESTGVAGTVPRRRLQVESVPVCSVQFTADKGTSGKLWIYGAAAQVHALDVGSRWLNWLRR